mgnify:CR=1 FL=1
MPGLRDNLLGEFYRHQIDLDKIARGNGEVLRGLLWDLRDELAAEIVQHPDLTQKNLRQRQQAQVALFAQIDGILGGSRSQISQTAAELLEKTAQWENNWGMGVYRDMGILGGIPILTPEQLKAVASNALVEGAPSSEWWGRQNDKVRVQFADEIRKGVLSGETLDQLVARIRGKSTGKRSSYRLKDGSIRFKPEFTGGIMELNTRQAEALAHTSAMQVAADTRRTLYAGSSIVEGVTQISTLDGRTTEVCIRRHNKTWLFEKRDRKDWSL